jgi:hypothetical protein
MLKLAVILIAAAALLLPAAATADVRYNLQPTYYALDGTTWPKYTRAGCHQMLSLGAAVADGTVFTIRGNRNGTIVELGQVVYTSGPYAPTYFTVRLWFGITWVWVEQGRVPHTSNQVPVTC